MMAYTPSIQDLADIVRRWRSNLAEAYPPVAPAQVQLPPVQVPGWAPDYVPPMPGSGQPFVPGGTTVPGGGRPLHQVISPTDTGPVGAPAVLPTPGASTEFGFPTVPRGLSASNFVRAPGGYGSG